MPAAATAAAGGDGSNGQVRVRTDLTRTHFRGYVRRDERWPEDSDQYRAGCDIEHRKLPPPKEVPGDAFDRQRVIPGFDQGLIERQTCLVLGAGGIGQDVALVLARLGVGRIILVDRDVYDANNLTRQCLGCKDDVGLRKVDVAAKTLRERHCIVSEVEAVQCDVVTEWPRVVELARRSTVVFNGIDVGLMWDYCVNALCKELGIPVICGQSFGWKYMVEMYTGREGEVCAFCYDSTSSAFAAKDSAVSRKGGVLERLQAFRAARGMSDPVVSAESLQAFLAEDRQFLCAGGELCGTVVASALARAGLASLDVEQLPRDLLSFLKAFNAEVVDQLLPGKISALPDIAFIPRPAHAETRYVGSWVCPCLGCSVTMVSQWAAWLTAPLPEAPEDGQAAPPAWQRRKLPQAVTFNLDLGMTTEEQVGYELGALGMPLHCNERRFACEASSDSCAVCAAAALPRAEESLFVGRNRVALAPARDGAGDVVPLPSMWRALPPAGSAERASAAARALARRTPLATLGEEYANVVVPAMPALDWEAVEDPAGSCPASPSSPREGAALPAWPLELSTVPLFKVPLGSEDAAHPSALYGVASGVRSALVRSCGRWWRLKGCGNRDEGFPVQACGDRGELNVRGCCFKHTADAEMRMTELARAALEAAGLDCANRAVGAYRYECAPGWPMPAIARYCGVFETLGNARLGDHLLAGLLSLLQHLLPASPDNFASLREAVASGRGLEGEEAAAELWPTSTVASCGMPTADVCAELARRGARLAEVVPPEASAMGGAVPEALAAAWAAARGRLEQALPAALSETGEPSLLMWLAWRLGWECGATMRALHCADIAWGTYPDAMGIHCNAHANNLVVKPPGAGTSASTFLAALDFDMAFTKDGYLPEAAASHASLGLDTWEGVLNFEATMGMKATLSGDDFANTGVANNAAAGAVPESHAVVEIALRDTLVSAYDLARTGDAKDPHPHSPRLFLAARELVQLALCLTTHIEG